MLHRHITLDDGCEVDLVLDEETETVAAEIGEYAFGYTPTVHYGIQMNLDEIPENAGEDFLHALNHAFYNVIHEAAGLIILNNIREICESRRQAERRSQTISINAPTKSNRRAGYVYILRAQSGEYKIGRTIDYTNRMRTFGVQLPFQVEYELVIQSDDYKGLEESLHRLFGPKRINGEWFSLTPDDINQLRNHYANRLVDLKI